VLAVRVLHLILISCYSFHTTTTYLQYIVNAIPPAIGEDEVGFSEALGEFDTMIDTLGDEAKLSRVNSFEQGVERVFAETGVGSKLKRDHKCERCVGLCVHGCVSVMCVMCVYVCTRTKLEQMNFIWLLCMYVMAWRTHLTYLSIHASFIHFTNQYLYLYVYIIHRQIHINLDTIATNRIEGGNTLCTRTSTQIPKRN